jgi:hypothetical protein
MSKCKLATSTTRMKMMLSADTDATTMSRYAATPSLRCVCTWFIYSGGLIFHLNSLFPSVHSLQTQRSSLCHSRHQNSRSDSGRRSTSRTRIDEDWTSLPIQHISRRRIDRFHVREGNLRLHWIQVLCWLELVRIRFDVAFEDHRLETRW